MPNHITNIITVIEGEYDLDSIKSFEDAMPMPDSLRDEGGEIASEVERAMGVSPSYLFMDDKKSVEDLREIYVEKSDQEQIDRALENIEKYGSATWYQWRLHNWGTKWNMYEREFEDDKLVFLTAWSAPLGWIEQFSKTLPDGVVLKLEWADEDFGCNTGEALLSNEGEEIYEDDNESNQAYERAIALLGQPDNLQFIEGNWTWVEDED